MHPSLLWRQHWRLVAAVGALTAGFVAAAPVAGALAAAMGAALLGIERFERRGDAGLGEETLGDFGYLEVGPSPLLGRERQ